MSPPPASTSPTQASIHASADQIHFSSTDQTHTDIVLPKPQAIVAAHLSILFAVIEFLFLFFMYLHMGLVAVVVVDDFDSGFVEFGCGGGG